MFPITSIAGKVKDLGPAWYSQCPACKGKSPLHLTLTYLTPKVYYIPTVRLRQTMVATCPSCQRKWEVKEKKAKELYKNSRALLLSEDLKLVKSSTENPLFQLNFDNFSRSE